MLAIAEMEANIPRHLLIKVGSGAKKNATAVDTDIIPLIRASVNFKIT